VPPADRVTVRADALADLSGRLARTLIRRDLHRAVAGSDIHLADTHAEAVGRRVQPVALR